MKEQSNEATRTTKNNVTWHGEGGYFWIARAPFVCSRDGHLRSQFIDPPTPGPGLQGRMISSFNRKMIRKTWPPHSEAGSCSPSRDVDLPQVRPPFAGVSSHRTKFAPPITPWRCRLRIRCVQRPSQWSIVPYPHRATIICKSPPYHHPQDAHDPRGLAVAPPPPPPQRRKKAHADTILASRRGLGPPNSQQIRIR